MLNVQDIAERIAQPQRVTKDDLLPLKDLSAKYPYTQLFSILYLKGLNTAGDVHFEDELNKHAYRVGDRVHLYELLKSNDPVTLTEPVNLTVVTESNAIEPETVIEAIVNLPEEKIIQQEIEPVDPILPEDTVLDQNESSGDLESIPYAIQTETSEIKVKEEVDAKFTNPEGTEESIQKDHSEENAQVDKGIDEIEKEETLEKDALDTEILHYALTSSYTLGQLSEEENKELDKRLNERIGRKTDKQQADEISREERKSFISWLTSNKNYLDEVNTDMEAISAVVKDFADFDPSERLFGEIDKPRREFFSPIKKAKESLREEGLPVSETLAKIYVAQGNYTKAINAYTQLSLKYPEKKIFFANLIEDLTKKLNAE